MCWATLWAIFSQAHLVTLAPSELGMSCLLKHFPLKKVELGMPRLKINIFFPFHN
jgi:hypothetical protein